MTRFIDNYKILQVHSSAEDEVIEGAYKKLCKKYHPDVCKIADAEEKIKAINHAYDILSHKKLKEEYDLEYKSYYDYQQEVKQKPIGSEKMAKKILEEYFHYISRGNYEKAYSHISDHDKKNIRYVDFVDWQKALSDLYEIISYKFIPIGVKNEKDPIYKQFRFVYDFDISLIEVDKRRNEPIETNYQRYIVIENDQLKLFLGQSKIKELTMRLRECAEEELDISKEFYEKILILREIKREIARSARYNRPFSLVVFEAFDIENQNSGDLFKSFIDQSYQTKKMLIRNTDFYGRWSKSRFFLILPETRLNGAKATTEKLIESLKKNTEYKDLTICAGVVQYKHDDLQELIDIAIACVISARKKGPWIIEN